MLLWLLAGLSIGLMIGVSSAWAIVTSRERISKAIALGIEVSRTAAAEVLVNETREQLAVARHESKELAESLRKHQAYIATTRTKLAEAEKNVQEQKALLAQAETRLSDTFQSLAAQALAANNRGFLTLAEQNFKTIKQEATAELDARKTAIETLVKPVGETLARYQTEVQEFERRRQTEMGAVGEQLRQVAATQAQLQGETSRLVTALKSPPIRGRWGEIALRKTAELAGMTAYCDFREQESAGTEDGRVRPDMVVNLPAGRDVIVDSKVPLAAFLEALEATDDESRNAALDKHAKQVAYHVDVLSRKEYWGQFPSAPEFVVLFIPNDSFLAAAAERNPDLIEYALSKKIVIATPMTFIALLRAVEYGWRQHIAVKNAYVISELGQELSNRFGILVDHLKKVGAALGKAAESYNAAVGSFELRLLPMARKFKDLGAAGRREIEDLPLMDTPFRTVIAPEEDLAAENQ